MAEVSSMDMFKDKLMLAPLAGINDIAFRVLCRRYGADIAFTGMVNSEALVRKNEATLRLAETVPEERPVCIQLFGNEPAVLADAARIIEFKADFIDINMGCPDRDVMKQGAGAALMAKPDIVQKIVSEVKRSITVPLSVKIRSGLDRQDPDSTVSLAKLIEKSGCDALIVHPRTAKQGYSGKADWSVIREVKRTLSIPVVGNGDVGSLQDYLAIKQDTGCESVMIGRAAMRNPKIFHEIRSGGQVSPTQKDRIDLFYEYLDLAKRFGIIDQIPWRIRGQMLMSGFQGSARLREWIGSFRDDQEFLASLSSSPNPLGKSH